MPNYSNDIPFASEAAEAAYQTALRLGVKINRQQVREMLQAFDIEHGVHELNNSYPMTVEQIDGRHRRRD